MSDAARADGRVTLLAAALLLSACADIFGGLWGLFDWRGVSAFMADLVPDWAPVGRGARLGLDGGALRQLWANLGAALVALGAAQALAGWWVGQGRPEGITLARLIGLSLVGASLLMAGPGGQLSSLVTEGARGLLILALVLRATRGRQAR